MNNFTRRVGKPADNDAISSHQTFAHIPVGEIILYIRQVF